MRTRIALASTIIAAGSLVPCAFGQLPGILGGRKATTPDPAARPATPDPAKADKTVIRTSYDRPVEIPGPSLDDDDKLAVPLPTVPIEPYMLTKDAGPFMVLAYTFRGPDAPREALAVVLELRSKHNLPAYVLLSKDFPGKSIIRGVPPQAELQQKVPALSMPEAIKTLDEAAVMVGNEKTVKDSTELMKKVKCLHLACFEGGTRRHPFRQGKELSRAIRTTNPFVPAELLFAQKPDVMLGQMNGGPYNIMRCPGRFSLQVAEFTGRSSFDPENDKRFKSLLTKSPLETAAEDAERLAEALNKDKQVQQVGAQAYVYHDRFASRVMVGAFQAPGDPNAKKVHDHMIRIASDLNRRKVTDTMIVPATNLTDLAPIKTSIQGASTNQARN